LPTSNIFCSASLPLLDIERTLAFLIALSARYQAISTPLSDGEIACADWLKAEFFRGGLQILQLHNPYDEEKGESRMSTSCTSTPGTVLLSTSCTPKKDVLPLIIDNLEM